MSATKDARIKELEAELSSTARERDDYKGKLETADEARQQAEAQRDQLLDEASKPTVPLYDDPYQALNEQDFDTVLDIVVAQAHERGLVVTVEEDEPAGPAAGPEASASEPAEVDPHAEVKAALVLNKLERAYVLPGGEVCFDETHARKFAGDAFESLTVISAE